MSRVTARRRVIQVDPAGDLTTRIDTLAAEEPLELRIGGRPVTVTMRTPGHDFDLVTGWLVGEGLLRSPDDLRTASYCDSRDADGRNTYNVVDVALAGSVDTSRLARTTYTTSACGVCGTASIDDVRVRSSYDLRADATTVDATVLAALPDRLRDAQEVFDRTGGLHAAGLFTADGSLVCAREDVGRHNAVDKVVGWAFREGRLPLRGHVLQVSGRASFELVQKAVVAGIPVLAAVSAPSSLAAELAAESGLTLAGFVRGGGFNVYAGGGRVQPAMSDTTSPATSGNSPSSSG
jgi:FdhD protein